MSKTAFHSYHDMVMSEEVDEKFPNRIRYFGMAFRPAGVLLFCLALTVIISIPCIIAIVKEPPSSTGYSVAMAILTGVIASGLVSISIELANNYRHNRQRFVVLSEYLYMISSYERFMSWANYGKAGPYKEEYESHLGDEDFDLTDREKGVAELVYAFGPIMEDALEKGREYLSIKEIQHVTQVVDAINSIEEQARGFLRENLKDQTYEAFDCFKEPFRSKLVKHADFEGIYYYDHDLIPEVAEYMLSHPEELDVNTKSLISYALQSFDEHMHALQSFGAREPVVYDNLVPVEEMIKRHERKLGIEGTYEEAKHRVEEQVTHSLQKADK